MYLKKKIDYILGPEKNVLRRFYIGLLTTKADQIVRISADNPFICWKSIDNLMTNNKINAIMPIIYIPYKNNFIDNIDSREKLFLFKKNIS